MPAHERFAHNGKQQARNIGIDDGTALSRKSRRTHSTSHRQRRAWHTMSPWPVDLFSWPSPMSPLSTHLRPCRCWWLTRVSFSPEYRSDGNIYVRFHAFQMTAETCPLRADHVVESWLVRFNNNISVSGSLPTNKSTSPHTSEVKALCMALPYIHYFRIYFMILYHVIFLNKEKKSGQVLHVLGLLRTRSGHGNLGTKW
jgi:hypothetical protein